MYAHVLTIDLHESLDMATQFSHSSTDSQAPASAAPAARPTCEDTTIAFVGCGTMGSAIAEAFVQAHVVPSAHILAFDPAPSARAHLARLGCTVFDSAQEMLEDKPTLTLFAVKPQVLPAVMSPLADALKDSLVVSIAAGISLNTLAQLLPGARLIRVMPNLCVSELSEAATYAMAPSATSADAQLIEQLFSAVGCIQATTEENLDVAGVLSGCGPAFMALVVDAFTRSAVEFGISAQNARELILYTMKGSAEHLLRTHDHPRAFMDQVTSPKGTTAQGLKAFEPLCVQAVQAAVEAALAKTYELQGK